MTTKSSCALRAFLVVVGGTNRNQNARARLPYDKYPAPYHIIVRPAIVSCYPVQPLRGKTLLGGSLASQQQAAKHSGQPKAYGSHILPATRNVSGAATGEIALAATDCQIQPPSDRLCWVPLELMVTAVSGNSSLRVPWTAHGCEYVTQG